ncbi:MAG: hypothetical protein HY054_04690 [Proteobacteria bacterium]|nr:hypothetical protein [Pseudomonadota bacterium]
MHRWLFVALALLAACSAPAAPEPRAPSPFAAGTYTILSGSEALALSHQCSRPSPGPVEAQWTPTGADIQALEPNLGTILQTHLTNAHETTPVADYYRQYAGFVVHGRRAIYVNGIARSAVEESLHLDWRTHAFGICDGGPITFGIIFDPEAGEFTQFAFNGAI